MEGVYIQIVLVGRVQSLHHVVAGGIEAPRGNVQTPHKRYHPPLAIACVRIYNDGLLVVREEELCLLTQALVPRRQLDLDVLCAITISNQVMSERITLNKATPPVPWKPGNAQANVLVHKAATR